MSVRRRLAASVLTFEAIAVLFGIAVAIRVAGVEPVRAVGGGVGLSVLCLLSAGLLRTRAGFVLGSVTQLLVLATGFVVTAMWVIGAIFAGLWCFALYLGAQAVAIERERGAG